MTQDDHAAILKLAAEPDSWIQPHIAAAASKIASADQIEHFRDVTTLALEGILSLLELDGIEPAPAVVIAHLLDPQSLKATWESVSAKGKLSPVSAPIGMIDRLTHLQTTPQDGRELYFAGAVAHLRAIS